MAHFQAISKAAHTSKCWQSIRNYSFAAQDVVINIVAHEFVHVLMHMPIGFVKKDDEYTPVAVLGLQSGRNLFVASDGKWVGGYTPATYRVYPFALADTIDRHRVLAIDENSGLIKDKESEESGEPFFDNEGNPTNAIKEVLAFLIQMQSYKEETQNICRLLAENKLIRPWPINIQTESGERKVEGLFCIDETELANMPIEALEKMQKAGAIAMAYCQVFSMQHLQTLAKRMVQDSIVQQVQPVKQKSEFNFDFLGDTGNLRFDMQ